MTAPIIEKVRKARNLPSLPAVAVDILKLTRSPDADVEAIASAIEKDPALAAKMLKAVNSSMFGLSGKISTVPHAVSMLGTRSVEVIALSFSLVEVVNQGPRVFDYESYWTRAICGAILARRIAPKALKDQAFVGGLLMDIGIMAAATTAKSLFRPVVTEWKKLGRRDAGSVSRHLGVLHSELSRELLTAWGLPADLCQAIGEHLSDSDIPLARILRAASLVTGLVCGDRAFTELDGIKSLCHDWTGVDGAELDRALKEVPGQVIELSSMLKLDTMDPASYEKVQAAATREFGYITVATGKDRLPSVPPEVAGCSFEILFKPSEHDGTATYGFELDERLKITVGPNTVEYDPADRTARGEALLIRDQVILDLGSEGVPLGEGDLLLLHGKGLTSARNIIEEAYGSKRLRDHAAGSAGLDPGSFLAALFEDLYVFTGGRPQETDLILIAMRVDPRE